MYEHGPITLEQHSFVMNIPEQYSRSVGYCFLVYWVPNHGLHARNCKEN